MAARHQWLDQSESAQYRRRHLGSARADHRRHGRKRRRACLPAGQQHLQRRLHARSARSSARLGLQRDGFSRCGHSRFAGHRSRDDRRRDHLRQQRSCRCGHHDNQCRLRREPRPGRRRQQPSPALRRIRFGGGERTISLGRYTNNPAAVLGSGSESLKFETAADGPATTFTNGTCASSAMPPVVRATSQRALRIRHRRVQRQLGSGHRQQRDHRAALGLCFRNAQERPDIEVEAGGYLNLSDQANARDAASKDSRAQEKSPASGPPQTPPRRPSNRAPSMFSAGDLSTALR